MALVIMELLHSRWMQPSTLHGSGLVLASATMSKTIQQYIPIYGRQIWIDICTFYLWHYCKTKVLLIISTWLKVCSFPDKNKCVNLRHNTWLTQRTVNIASSPIWAIQSKSYTIKTQWKPTVRWMNHII